MFKKQRQIYHKEVQTEKSTLTSVCCLRLGFFLDYCQWFINFNDEF